MSPPDGTGTDGRAAPSPVRLLAREVLGWRRFAGDGAILWFKGGLNGDAPEPLLARLAARASAAAVRRDLVAEIAGLDGHFAVVVEGDGWTLAAVDRIRSIPLFFATRGAETLIATEAPVLREALGPLPVGQLTGGPLPVDPDQLLTFAMSGFTFPGRTLHAGLDELAPGEVLFVDRDGGVAKHRYHDYRPWRVVPCPDAALKAGLAACTLAVFEKLVASCEGRPIAVPLSAGLDSRLVVAALHHLGHRDVRCFSYGWPGNHEAVAARRIAERLGYPWTFVPHGMAQQAAFYAGETARRYGAETDTFAAVPFQQDLYAVTHLRDTGWLPSDAIVVNGQSGDYITGNHIPPALGGDCPGDPEARWLRITGALVAKHYSLWDSLKTPANLARLDALLRADLEAVGATLGEPALDYALFEASEYRNRQSKYVVNGQRIYEFAGFDWRLPLWDRDWVDFWEGVPRAGKVGQRLYREMLVEQDWGGVWRDIPGNQRIVPSWLRWARLGAKAAHAPLGRARWRHFEKRYLDYWMNVTGHYAIAPYRTVRRDRRGHRNAISWHVDAYLAAKGIGVGGVGAAVE